MSFNNRSFNPNIWDTPRHNNSSAFINNQQNFYGNNNNNSPQNFPLRHPRPNFPQSLLGLPPIPAPQDLHPNFRSNFNNNNNNNPDFSRNNSNRGRQNFHHNQQKWQNRGNDNQRFNNESSSKDNSNNGERFSREPSAENSTHSDDSKPKSLVEHLKSTMKKIPRSKSQENNTNESIDACAKNASKKLLSQLKTMDKDNVKELINNPKQPHRKAVLNIQAREKLREGMRKQLKTLGAEDDQEASFDAVDSVNYENIPETLIAQIGRTVDMDLGVEDMDLQQDIDEEIIEDKDIEVVKTNLGNDFLYGSEMLLMNGFNLLGESENESDLKIDDRFFPPPLPVEPINRPPEPVPPPEIPLPPPPSNSVNTNRQNWLEPPLPSSHNNDWDIDSARNPDPPAPLSSLNSRPSNSNSKTTNVNSNEKIQTIPVIVSHPASAPLTSPTTGVTIKHENSNLISLSQASEQIPTINNKSTTSVATNPSKDDDAVFKTPQTTVSQDSFKTPAVPISTSTPFSMDGSKTPFIDDGGKTPFIGSDDGGKTPFIDDGGKTPFIGSSDDGGKTPYIGSSDDGGKTPMITDEKKSENSSETPAKATEGEEKAKPEQRANETYGEYRRRLANLAEEENRPKEEFSNKPAQRSQQQQKQQQQQPQRKSQIVDWDDDNRTLNSSNPSTPQQNSNNNNNDRNNWARNNNDPNNRKSRFEMNRSRDRKNNRGFGGNNNNNNNNNNRRNNSRERNNNNNNNQMWDYRDVWEREKPIDDMRDAFNYRFDTSMTSSHDSGEVLSNILNPKPVQFKGSFNKRSGYTNNSREYNNRRDSRSRERTPTNNSVERELFGDFQNPSTSTAQQKDAQPNLHSLKKIMDLENELSRWNDKMHGIDKVIANLQSERINCEKNITRISHEKKIELNRLLKSCSLIQEQKMNERTTSRDREKETSNNNNNNNKKEKEKETVTSTKKTSESVQEQPQKKRKLADDLPAIPMPTNADDEANKKKKKYTLEEEPKTAAQRAKEKEEEERRKRIEEIRRQKQQRREKEEAERRRLEEQAKKESNDTILILNRDKTKEKEKNIKKEVVQASPAKTHKTDKSASNKNDERIKFNWADVIDPKDIQMKKPKIKFDRLQLSQTWIDQFKSGKYPQIDINELPPETSSQQPSNREKVKIKDEKPEKTESNTEQKPKKDDVNEQSDPLSLPKNNNSAEKRIESEQKVEKDPLAMDENEEISSPPTPGNNLPLNENDDTNMSEELPETNSLLDYSEWTGNFESHDEPIVHIQNIGKYMVCAAEDGKLYKYNLITGKSDAPFIKHTEICNSFLYDEKDKTIYTASSDGYVYRIKFRTFESVGSRQFSEPLQVIEKSKHALYVGAKSGNIYKLKMDLSDDADLEPLCCVESLILCLRYTKEGSRHILLISSRMSAIQVRDANDGLLLRTLSNDLTGVSIYDMVLDGSTIYCGSNLHEIFALDFTTGALIKKRSMSGAGAICVKIYKGNLIVACYDGNIYIFDLNAGDDAVNISGPSNMLLAMDLWNDKIIASTKDKTLKIINIPT